jgi:kelch-like protein 10
MGGFNGHVRQNTAEKYLLETNQWSAICPMHVQRSDASACTLNGNMYLIVKDFYHFFKYI